MVRPSRDFGYPKNLQNIVSVLINVVTTIRDRGDGSYLHPLLQPHPGFEGWEISTEPGRPGVRTSMYLRGVGVSGVILIFAVIIVRSLRFVESSRRQS